MVQDDQDIKSRKISQKNPVSLFDLTWCHLSRNLSRFSITKVSDWCFANFSPLLLFLTQFAIIIGTAHEGHQSCHHNVNICRTRLHLLIEIVDYNGKLNDLSLAISLQIHHGFAQYRGCPVVLCVA